MVPTHVELMGEKSQSAWIPLGVRSAYRKWSGSTEEGWVNSYSVCGQGEGGCGKRKIHSEVLRELNLKDAQI